MNRKIKLLLPAVLLLVVTLLVAACTPDSLNGANGNVCNNNGQCVTFSVHPAQSGASSSSAPSTSASTSSPSPSYSNPTPTPQSESPSASIPGATSSASAVEAITSSPPPDITASPVPTEGTSLDSSVHRCKAQTGEDTLISLGVDLAKAGGNPQDSQFFTCMALTPQETAVFFQLFFTAVVDLIEGKPFTVDPQYGQDVTQVASSLHNNYS